MSCQHPEKACMHALVPRGKFACAYRDAVVYWIESGQARQAWVDAKSGTKMFEFIAESMRHNDIPLKRP